MSENTNLDSKEEKTRQTYYTYVGSVTLSILLLGATYFGYRWWRNN